MKQQNYGRPNNIFDSLGVRLKKAKCIAYIVLIFAMAFTFVSCGKQPENKENTQKTQAIKVQNYIRIEYSPAYNKYAEPELVVDTEGLNALIGSQKIINYYKALMKSNEEYAEIYESMIEMIEEDPEAIQPFTDFFDVEFSKEYANLKNGDTIKVHIVPGDILDNASLKGVTEKMGIKFDKTEMEFKVTGLADLKKAEIDLNKLLQVDFGKYNGYATPSVEVDYDYFESLLVEDVVNNFYKQCNNWEVKDILSDDCSEWFYAEFDQSYNNLKNGDIIKVNIVLNDAFTEYGISMDDFETGICVNFDGGVSTYLVEGLVEPQKVIDIFKDIEQYIVYEGANGYGHLAYHPIQIPDNFSYQIDDLYFVKGSYTNTIKVIYLNTNLGEISYHIDGTGLTDGDVIELSASASGFKNTIQNLENLGYIIPTTRKNVTVPDLGEYIKGQDQLTPEILAAIKNEIYIEDEIDNIDKLYFASYKPGVECNYDSTSFIVGIYYRGSFFSSGYYIDKLYDIIIKPDGTIVIETYENDSWSYYETLEAAIEALAKDRYDFVVLE